MEKVLGKYKILGNIRTSSMLLGLDTKTNQKVAIKRHSITNKHDYTELKELYHKNLLTVLDIIEDNKFTYLVYSHYEQDLEDYIDKKGKLEEKEVKDLMGQLVGGYRKLVNSKLLHKNIKPRNIMISEGILKLGDYPITDTSGAYTAPEIIKEDKKFSSASDIWSIGAVMHYMLNAKSLLITATIDTTLIQAQVTEHCLDFLIKCLDHDPMNRPIIEKIVLHPFMLPEGIVLPNITSLIRFAGGNIGTNNR